MKNKIFKIIILICILISKPSFSLFHSFNLEKTECAKKFNQSLFYEATPLCLELIKEMEEKNISGEEYPIAIYLTSVSALRSADYNQVKLLFKKFFNFVEKNDNRNMEILFYEINAANLYASFLINHQVDIKLADKLLNKYYPVVKELPSSFFGNESSKDMTLILFEIGLADLLLSQNSYENNFQQVNKTDYTNKINNLKTLLPKARKIEKTLVDGKIHKENFNFRLKLNLALSKLHKRVNQNDQAEKYLLNNISIVKKNELSDFTKANHLMELGRFYNRSNNYNKAIKYLTETLEIMNKNPLMKKEPSYGGILEDIADSYWYLGNSEEGYHYSKQAAQFSLDRLNKKVSEDTLFSDSYELEMAKERFSTHNRILNSIFFDRLYNNNKPTLEIAKESFVNGQLLPSLETAQALAHLKVSIQTKNDQLSKLYKKKQNLEKNIISLESQRDFLRVEKNINHKKINELDELLIAFNDQLNDTNSILEYKFPNYKDFGVNQISVSDTWMALEPNEAIFVFYQPYKNIDNEETQDEFMIHGWFAVREYVTPLILMKINKKDFFSLKEHLDFSTNLFQYSQFPFEISYEIYTILFKHILEEPILQEHFKNIDHLIIVNDGMLYQLPYWALINKPIKKNGQIKDQPWISKDYAITVAPSLNTFVTLRSLSKKKIGIKFSVKYTPDGVDMIIDQVFDEMPAKKAGLKKQDIIIGINNEKIKSPLQLVDAPKDKKLELLIVRNNKKISISIPPLLENKNVNSSNFLEFVGIGNPSGLKNNTLELASAAQIPSINEIYADIGTNTRGVNKRFIEEMPALPGTEKELKAIAKNFDSKRVKLFLQDQASETVVKNLDLSNTKYLSFASHAVVKGEMGKFDEPGIILSPPDISSEENDGLLTASEIAEMELNADLVILSACNTAAGINDDITSEGLTGLAKSFFYAGAKELLVSNWRVADEYAARLTTGMLDHLTKNENVTKAEALQYSINELIDENLHPIFWAPFMLVGDGL